MKRSLTTSQARELLRAASLLPLVTREQFISAVDERLRGIHRRLTDDDVHAAIISVLATTTQHSLLCDSIQQEATMIQPDDDLDARGLLKDGRRMRTPMQAMDSLSRSVAEGMADRRRADDAVRNYYSLTDALHRPGFRFCTDKAALAARDQAYADSVKDMDHRASPPSISRQAANDAREAAYQEMVSDMCNAWRKPASADAIEFVGAKENDLCTVREGGHDEGSPGHLRMVNGELKCVPDVRRQSSPPRRQDSAPMTLKDAAWHEMCREMTEAWRVKG